MDDNIVEPLPHKNKMTFHFFYHILEMLFKKLLFIQLYVL
jgi:hypothetical protein